MSEEERFQDEDILFVDVTIIDGSGTRPRYRGNVLIRSGFIHTITPRGSNNNTSKDDQEPQASQCRVIDGGAGHWTLTPGFIDMHAHSDLSLLHTPPHLAKITQGVTTEVIGQDGIGYAPVTDTTLSRIRAQIAGWNGNPTSPPNFFDRWRSVESYLDTLDTERIATNAAYLVPQGNLRMLVKGYSSDVATTAEVAEMCSLLAQSLEEGAVGMSSGLTYVPGMFADDEELAALCAVVARYGGYYCPHHRSYGKGAMQAYREMIALARKTGVRLHLTHATLNFNENAGRAQELLNLIDEAIADGVDVTLDTYPYLPGSTTLSATLPSWAAAADDKHALLDDAEQLARIKKQVLVDGSDGCHGVTIDFSTIEISGVGDASLAERYVGKTIANIAAEQKRDAFDVYIDILKQDDFNTMILMHCGHEDNVRAIMRHPRHTGGSDGILTPTRPHPRGWGTFPRYLGHYARDLARGVSRDLHHPDRCDAMEGVGGDAGEGGGVAAEEIFAGGLEEAVAHLTSRAANIIRAFDRGLVKEGCRADLVLFDAETIRDVATYAHPKMPAQGIRTVLVNGCFAIDEGQPTLARNGRTIRMRVNDNGKYRVG